MKKSKRVISKSKTYGFNPWVAQVDAIRQIMEETGAKAESVVLRKLIDEALGCPEKEGLPDGVRATAGSSGRRNAPDHPSIVTEAGAPGR
jgi:hypothetical protein